MQNGQLPTKKQKQTLDFIADFIGDHGYAPSFREVQSALGVKSVSTVASHVDGLIAKGFLKKGETGARTLELTTPRARATSSPSWRDELRAWASAESTPAEAKELVEQLEKYL